MSVVSLRYAHAFASVAASSHLDTFAVQQQLSDFAATLAGSRVRTTYRQDPTLLGGAVVRIGSTVYDGSIRAQLQQLKQKLVNA